MIEVTATMFPRTVRKDRSLFAQIAPSAMTAAFEETCPSLLWGRPLFLGGRGCARRRLDLHGRAVRQLAHRAERSDDDLVAFLRARKHFEVLLAGDCPS